MIQFTVEQIAQAVDGEILGHAALVIECLSQLDQASANALSFVREQAHATDWDLSDAGAVLATAGLTLTLPEGKAIVFVKDADLAMAKVLSLFAPQAALPALGIHPTAVIDPSAKIGEGARVGPYCVIGRDVQIGSGAVLHSAIHIMDRAVVGDDVTIYPHVVIREHSVLGHRVILHSGVVLGGDGFGYCASEDGQSIVKLPHIGNVILHDDVELGANTTVDRGKFASTVIGACTKIDNLCQIAHNVEIGCGCLIAAQAGIAGSTKIGNHVMMGGKCGVKDHVVIGDHVKLAGGSGVISDVPPKAIFSGMPAKDSKTHNREVYAVKKLPELMKELSKVRKQFKK